MKYTIVTFSILTVSLLGCGQEQATSNDNAEIVASRGTGLETGGDDQSGDGTAVQAPSTFALFCEKASPIASEYKFHERYYNRFCTSDAKPKKFLAKSLVDRAYNGSGDPRIVQTDAPVHDKPNRTTSIGLAASVQVPVTAKHYFEMMTAFMDDPQRAQDLGIVLIEGTKKMVTVEKYPPDSEAHVGGWLKHNLIETEVSSQRVQSEYESRSDHWRLQEAEAYLIAGELTRSIQGVSKADMYTAILQVGKKTHIMTLVFTETDNKGIPSAAQETLIKKVTQGVRNAYNNASLIKDETP